MTGYEVRAAITGTLGHFWQESFGQIYPTLAALEADGLVRPRGEGRTSGSVVEITEAGTDRLRELLAEPHPSSPPRNALLLRLFFGEHLPRGRARELLLEVEEGSRAALERYAAIRSEPSDGDPGQTYRTITLSFGEHVARAQLDWARESLTALETLEEEPRARG
jgi:DNA-binding PadR family transcriptional regulator